METEPTDTWMEWREALGGPRRRSVPHPPWLYSRKSSRMGYDARRFRRPDTNPRSPAIRSSRLGRDLTSVPVCHRIQDRFQRLEATDGDPPTADREHVRHADLRSGRKDRSVRFERGVALFRGGLGRGQHARAPPPAERSPNSRVSRTRPARAPFLRHHPKPGNWQPRCNKVLSPACTNGRAE
jgi:hypothetical protein